MSIYQTFVYAIPIDVPDDQSLPQPCVIMSCYAQRFYSLYTVQGGTEGPIYDRSFKYQAEHPSTSFASHDHSPSSPSWAIVSSVVDSMLLPFPLDQIWWLDRSAGKKATWTCVTRDELMSKIARVVSGEVNDPRNEGRKTTMVKVNMMHKLALPESEICVSRTLDCVICLKEVTMGDLLRMDCSHQFHKGCLEAWLRLHQTCPLCRCKLASKKL